MIAYLLLRLAARSHCIKMLALRFAELVRQFLFTRRAIATITKPPPTTPANSSQQAPWTRWNSVFIEFVRGVPRMADCPRTALRNLR
jgi:hypothetical protein